MAELERELNEARGRANLLAAEQCKLLADKHQVTAAKELIEKLVEAMGELRAFNMNGKRLRDEALQLAHSMGYGKEK